MKERDYKGHWNNDYMVFRKLEKMMGTKTSEKLKEKIVTISLFRKLPRDRLFIRLFLASFANLLFEDVTAHLQRTSGLVESVLASLCGLGYLSKPLFPSLQDVYNIPCSEGWHGCCFASCKWLCKHSGTQGWIVQL